MKPRSAQSRNPSGQPGAGNAQPRPTAAQPGPASQVTSYPHEVASEHWEAFLNDFSTAHEGWDSEIRVFLPDKTGRIQAQGLPFEGVSLDYKANECTTTVSAGDAASDHLQRLVPSTTRIIALNQDELEIDAADRSRTLLRCLRPRR